MAVTPVFQHFDRALEGVERRGVVHVGAHKGQEVGVYLECGFELVVLVEPNPAHTEDLARLEQHPEVRVVHSAVGSGERAVLQIPKFSEQASLLSGMEIHSTVEVPVVPMRAVQPGCNVAVLDVQGCELDCLRTAELSKLDAVVVEMDNSTRYDGAGSPEQIRTLLASSGMELGSVWPHRWEYLTEEVWLRC